MKNKLPKGDKRVFRYGGISVVITAVVIFAVIVLNLLASTLEEKYSWKRDLTGNSAYTLSVNTVAVLREMKQDAVIYAFLPTAGTEAYATLIDNLVDIYGSHDHITVRKIDPRVNPTQMSRFNTDTKTLTEYAVVIADANDESRFYAVNYAEMSQYDSTTYKTSFVLQQKITSALNNLENNLKQNVYLLTGHGEPVTGDNATALINRINMDGYSVQSLDLTAGGVVLGEGDVVLVLNPTSDLTADEMARLKDFLVQRHGRMLFCANRLVNDQGEKLANFSAVLDAFHISIGQGVVAEKNTGAMASTSPVDILAVADQNHEITASVRTAGSAINVKESTVYGYAYGTGLSNDTIKETWTPIVMSSPDAVLVPWENYNGEYREQLDGATGSVQTLCAAYTKVDTSVSGAEVNTTTKIVLMGSDSFLLGDTAVNLLGNSNILRNTVSWLAGRDVTDEIVITGVDMDSAYVYMNQATKNIWFGVLVVALPCAILAGGLIVWIRRKNL